MLLELLKSAREKISRSENWLQNCLRNGKGGYCAEGAILNQLGCLDDTGDLRGTKKTTAIKYAILDLLDKQLDHSEPILYHHISGYRVVYFNNTHTHTEVLDMFDKAIAALESKKKEECLV